MNSKARTIGVMFGGESPEHDISIITGQFVISQLEKMGRTVVPVYVAQDGRWYSGAELGKLKFFKGDFADNLRKLTPLVLDISASQGRLVLGSGGVLRKKVLELDFVFPAFHGAGGEDGTIQGLLELCKVPYAGCGIFASALSIDKILTKEFLQSRGFGVTDFVTVSQLEWDNEDSRRDKIAQIRAELSDTVFVKPAHLGSSIGISKAIGNSELEDALELAFHYDYAVIVENAVSPMKDLTCAALSDGEQLRASLVQESVFGDTFLNYDEKYLNGGGTQTGESDGVVIPAEISAEVSEQIAQTTKQIFAQIGANGMLRVDYLLDTDSGKLYVNEINTLPGTIYNHLWEKSGVSAPEVIDMMITHGHQRANQIAQMSVEFNSNVLEDANNMKLSS